MKKLLLISALTLASFNASAATIDFQAEAATNGERGASIFNLQADNGLPVSVWATEANGMINTTWGAYLDGGGGGLGVCSDGLNGDAQCSEPSDDNVTPGERIVIQFGTKINLTSVDFLNANHGTTWIEDSHAHYTVDNGAEQQVDFFGSNGTVAFNEDGTEFAFYLHDTQLDTSQFYIRTMDFAEAGTQVNPVPIPAAVWLFATGLIGLAGIARRKKV